MKNHSYMNGWSCDWPPSPNIARNVVKDALKRGWLQRGPCFAVGPDCKGRIQGHHHDYRKPLEVVWCCLRHHKALDAERRKGVPLDVALANAMQVASVLAAYESETERRRIERREKAAQTIELFWFGNSQKNVSRRKKRRVSRSNVLVIKAGRWPKIGTLTRIA